MTTEVEKQKTAEAVVEAAKNASPAGPVESVAAPAPSTGSFFSEFFGDKYVKLFP